MTVKPHCSRCGHAIPRGMRGSIVSGAWLCPLCVSDWAESEERAEVERLAEIYESAREV